ncbi:MAG: hypothetical protein B7Z12_07465 [Caulobacter vibrioides]|uniref:Uncharacterized protein n=1 Tax=Caulobacter vibrioides TaxID=155892 RepID=A0A258D8U3_CAUVI|nr:MAG: hypothetical protein B7Z12_07465 [Caulobacter vibrioides]
MFVDGEHALCAVLGVQRSPQGLEIQAAGIEAHNFAVHAYREGEVQTEPLPQVGDGRLHGGAIMRGDGGAEAEVPGEQFGPVLQALRAKGPNAVEDCSGGGEFLANGALGVTGDRHIDRYGHDAQRQGEEPGVEDGQLGLEALEHRRPNGGPTAGAVRRSPLRARRPR